MPDYSLNWTASSSAIQEDKGISDAAEVGGLSASNLLLSIDRPARMPDSPLKSPCTKHNGFFPTRYGLYSITIVLLQGQLDMPLNKET